MDAKHTQVNKIASALVAAYRKGADEVVKLFSEGATIEFPMASSLGRKAKLSLTQFYEYLKNSLPKMPDLEFNNFKWYKVPDKDAYWAEARAESIIPSTGHTYVQDYVTYVEFENGKINYYKEYWNVLPLLTDFSSKEELQKLMGF